MLPAAPVIDALPVGIVAVDSQGFPRLSNPAAQKMFRAERLVHVRDWVATYGIKTVEGAKFPTERLPAVAVLMDGRAHSNVELRLDARQYRNARMLLSSARPLHGPDGSIAGAVIVLVDVTNHHQRSRWKRGGDLVEVLNDAIDGFWDWDIHSDLFSCSHRCCAILGEPDGAFPDPTSWLSRFHPDDLDRFHEALEGHLNGHSDTFSCNHRMKHADGTWLWLESHGRNIGKGANTRLVGWVTEQWRATGGAQLTLGALDHHGRGDVLLASKGRALWLGVADAIGLGSAQDVFDAITHAAQPTPRACRICHQLVPVGGIGCKVELNGELRAIEVDFLGHEHEMGGPGETLVMLVRDETDVALMATRLVLQHNVVSRAQAELDEAERAKRTFLGVVNHELKTPLHAVLGYVELMRENVDDQMFDNLPMDLDRVHFAATQLLDLVNDLLDVGRFEAHGEVDLVPQRLKLSEVLAAVLLRAEARCEASDITLTIGGYDKDLLLEVDPGRLAQILNHLLGNAIKFTEKGEVRFAIFVSDTDPRWVDFVVEDTGPGIAPERLTTLFDRFGPTADDHALRQFEGVGLGLTLSRRLARLMGGDLFVESELGAGSTFTARLPIGVTDLARASTSSSFSSMPVKRRLQQSVAED